MSTAPDATTVTTPLGLSLVVHRWGPQQGPPVVVLHGFMDSAEAFAATIESLPPRYRVMAPDQRGHGRSQHVGAGGYYHFPDYVMDLDAVLNALTTPEEPLPVLVGHSMGASVALYFAGAFPERLRALVLVDGLGPPSGDPAAAPQLMRRWVEAVNERAQRRETGTPQDVVRTRHRLASSAPGLGERHLERILDARTQPADAPDKVVYRFDRLHRTPGPWHLDGERFAAFCRAVRVPTLAVWGSRTPFRHSEVDTRQALLGDLREVTIEGAGHNIHLEQPEALGRTIGEFLHELDFE